MLITISIGKQEIKKKIKKKNLIIALNKNAWIMYLYLYCRDCFEKNRIIIERLSCASSSFFPPHLFTIMIAIILVWR